MLYSIPASRVDKYDVVDVQHLVPNYMGSTLNILFSMEYIFLFITKWAEDSPCHGHVSVHIIRRKDLSNLQPVLRERFNFHILKKKSLIINDFLELIPKDTKSGIQLVAHLKKQNILKDPENVQFIRNFRVLLISKNDGRGYDNLEPVVLGAEFQAVIDHDEAVQNECYLVGVSDWLNRNKTQNEKNDGNISEIDLIKQELNKEITDAHKKVQEALQKCDHFNHNLTYVHKRLR